MDIAYQIRVRFHDHTIVPLQKILNLESNTAPNWLNHMV